MKISFLFFLSCFSICYEVTASYYNDPVKNCSTETELLKKDIEIIKEKIKCIEISIQKEELIRKYEILPMQAEFTRVNLEMEKTLTKIKSIIQNTGITLPKDL